jgi:hypothetical protein
VEAIRADAPQQSRELPPITAPVSLACEPRRDSGSEQHSEHERQIADRHNAEPQDDLRRPVVLADPTHDAPQLARLPATHRDDAVAGMGAIGFHIKEGNALRHGGQDSTSVVQPRSLPITSLAICLLEAFLMKCECSLSV